MDRPVRQRFRRRRVPAAEMLVWGVLFFPFNIACAEDGLITQREISDMIPIAKAEGTLQKLPAVTLGKSRESTTSLPSVAESTAATSDNWAILPEFGYTPDQKFNGGFKFTGRDLTDSDLTFDAEFNQAVERQRGIDGAIIAPNLFGGSAVNVDEYHYYLSPDKYFFGVGNNHVSSPIAVHTYERQRALATLAYHWTRDLVFAISSGPRQTRISRSSEANPSLPATQDEFPRLVGLKGGRTNPVIVSAVYNDRASVTHPVQGWSAIAAVEHVNQNLDNDYHFTRFTLDGSYLHPFFTRDQVLGLHLNGEFLVGDTHFIPFFELASLGGADDMRGFFPDRFLGTSRLLVNSEYRVKAAAFNFRHIWDVQIDGVVFGDMGRVFISAGDLSHEFRTRASRLPGLFEDFRYSYGAGLRIELGEALVARIDAGFSNEQVGLVYLVFGHAF